MKLPRWSVWVAASLFVLVVAGCEGGGGSTTAGIDEQDTTGTGTLSLMLTDAPTEGLRAVYVTIDSVEVHVGDEEEGYWEVVADPDKTYNLLELVDGVLEHLGTTDLPSGLYTQMRLIIGLTPDGELNVDGNAHEHANYLLFEDDPTDTTQYELKIPSGIETGIKLVHEFEIVEGLTVELILDFDARESVVTAGKSGQYLLKPTIKVIDTLDNATIMGIVRDDLGDPIPGVRVTAQTSPIVESGTLTDDPTGSYTMYVAPGTYCVVAFKPPEVPDYRPAYGPGCAPTDPLDYYDIWPQDFDLTPVDTGNITGYVVTDGDINHPVELSFRMDCGDSPCDLIEVWPLSFAATSDPYTYTYTIGLPPGDYDVVANSGADSDTVPAAPVAAYTDTTVNFDFSSP